MTGSCRKLRDRKPPWWRLATWLVVAAATVTTGCHLSTYRRRADADGSGLIAEKDAYLEGLLREFHVYPDRRSRMFDPFDPDREPMPPDDPAAHELMHCVDGKRGFPEWHKYGETSSVQSPDFESFLPLNADGKLILDARETVRQAYIHSTDYQQQLENLFLSALDVSAERFRFDVQLFGGYGVDYVTRGRLATGGASESTLTASTRNLQLQKTFITGSDLVVGLANEFVWHLAGTNSDSASSLLTFSLVQPLLRRAGRARIMETLTLAERTLLANVRQMQRYRQGFQLNVFAGTGSQSGPNRRGGLFGGSGLTNFTGVGGGFGRVGVSGTGTSGGAIGAGAAGGLLGLLQEQQNIRNLEANITALRSSLAQLEAFGEAGRIDRFQVDQARQDLFERQSELLNARNQYQNSLLALKITLGLPPQLPVEVQDPLLDSFYLIDPAIVPLQNAVTNLQQLVGRSLIRVLPQGETGEALVIRWSPEMAAQLQQVRNDLGRLESLRQQFRAQQLGRVQADIEQLERVLPARLAGLRDITRRLNEALTRGTSANSDTNGPPELNVDTGTLDVEQTEQLPHTLRDSLAKLVERLNEEEKTAATVARDLDDLIAHGGEIAPEALTQQLVDRVFVSVPMTFTQLSDSLLEASLTQAQARTESVTLVPVRMESETALQVARAYRLDWMNARSSLVDTWRLIRFNANALRSDLSVTFSGDLGTTGNNPVKFRGPAGSLQAGVQIDPPFTRLLERNVYREALIDYQQARRGYYRFEDSISASLERVVRQIDLNQINFELRRAAVRVAVSQVELARLRLQEPPRPGVEQTFGPTTAQNLVTALSALRNAQDNFLSVWVNYEVLRRVLDLEMGTLQLDDEGIWIDPGPIGLEYGYPDRADWERRMAEVVPIPPALPIELVPPEQQGSTADELPPPRDPQ